MTVDTNSGYASMSNNIITYFLKDEAPKAPVFLYSINNENKVNFEGADEAEKTNLETRQKLIDLNYSLFLSESLEHIELMVPFDCIALGGHNKDYFGNYKKDLLFHQSGI
jgi:hypothetical protein